MEILFYTYQLSLLDNKATGRIKFIDNNGKVRDRQYELNKKMGQFMVENCGTMEQPNLRVINVINGGK